jgi:membrane associated rhomboid family serine protease
VTPLTGTFVVLNILLWVLYLAAGQPAGWSQTLLVPEHFRPVALLTSQFVHQSALHLALNMLLLWGFGLSVERGLGSGLFGVIYLGSGVFAGLLHVAVAYLFQAPADLALPAGGASGAVAGVMGAYAALYPHRRLRLPLPGVEIAGVTVILLWLGWEAAQAIAALAQGVELGVGHWAHVGGLVCGLLLGSLLSGEAREPAPTKPHHLDRELPASEAAPSPSEAAALAVERLTRIGAREHALALYRQSLEDGRPLALPPPVELHLAEWLVEERDWSAACDAFLSVAHSDAEPEHAARALWRAIELAQEHLHRPQLAHRLRQDLLARFPESRWSAVAAGPPEETSEGE